MIHLTEHRHGNIPRN